MKFFLALTYISEQEYLKNYPSFFPLDQFRCDQYEHDHQSLFKSKKQEEREFFEILHVFDEDESFETFILHQFNTQQKYKLLLDMRKKELSNKDVLGYRMYLPLIKARVFFQVTEAINAIKDNEKWEECNQIFKRVPDYSVCEMGVSKTPLVLLAIVR
jgi:hypothetical protein